MIFASEVKAILEYPDMTRKLNMKAVDQLMNYPGGAISPQTFFKDIYSLRPGHMLVCSPEKVEDIDYWDKKIKIIIRKITLGMGLGSARDEKEIK